MKLRLSAGLVAVGLCVCVIMLTFAFSNTAESYSDSQVNFAAAEIDALHGLRTGADVSTPLAGARPYAPSVIDTEKINDTYVDNSMMVQLSAMASGLAGALYESMYSVFLYVSMAAMVLVPLVIFMLVRNRAGITKPYGDAA